MQSSARSWRIPVFSLCLALLAASTAFAQVKKPEAKVTRFDIESISLRDVTFVFDVSVTNPYPVDLSMEAVRIAFTVEGAQVATAQTSEGFTVKAMGKRTSTFHTTLRYNEIMSTIKNYAEKDYLNTVIRTEIAIPLPKLPLLPPRVTFSYELSSRIPAIKPQVSITHFTIEQPSAEAVGKALKEAGRAISDQKAAVQAFSDILAGKQPTSAIQPKDLDIPLKVSFDIELSNQTKAPLAFTGLDYHFSINGNELIAGATTSVKNDKDRSVLHVSNTFSSRSLAGGVLEALKARKGSFVLAGSTTIKLPDEVRKEPLKMEFTEPGAFTLP